MIPISFNRCDVIPIKKFIPFAGLGSFARRSVLSDGPTKKSPAVFIPTPNCKLVSDGHNIYLQATKNISFGDEIIYSVC